MKLNPDLVRARCTEIEESVSRLERFRRLSREQFLADQDTLDLACYRLLVAIEAALALCYHVSAKRLRKVPEEYAECFGMLRDAGILPAELAGRLQQMARFRNLLVHMYWKSDYGLFACSGILFNHESPRRGKEFVTRKVTDGVSFPLSDPLSADRPAAALPKPRALGGEGLCSV